MLYLCLIILILGVGRKREREEVRKEGERAGSWKGDDLNSVGQAKVAHILKIWKTLLISTCRGIINKS